VIGASVSIENEPRLETAPIDGSFIESVDVFLDELSSLASSASDRGKFYQFLAARLIELTSSWKFVIWMMGADGKCIAPMTVSNSQVRTTSRCGVLSSSEFHQVVDSSNALVIKSRNQQIIAGRIPHPIDTRAILALYRPASERDDLTSVYVDLLTAVCEITGEFERRKAIEDQHLQVDRLKSFVQLVNNCHSSLDSTEIAFHLTNDARQLLRADRVWLFSNNYRLKLLSCSSVAEVESRAHAVELIRALTREAFRFGESYVFARSESTAVPPKYRNLKKYFQQCPTEGLYVTLLRGPRTGTPIGSLVVECFEPHDRMQLINGLKNIVPCAESALKNSMALERLPLRRLWGMIAWVSEQFHFRAIPRTVAILAVLAAAVVSLFAIKSDFNLAVTGEIRPLVERNIFAPADGIVDSIAIEYGDRVVRNQPIAKLFSPDYQLKLKQLQGQLEVVRKKLETDQVLRMQAINKGEDEIQIGNLTANIEQGKLEIESLNQQIEFYLGLTEKLTIVSPISGQVTTRDVQQSLLNRPVSRGNRLISVAETDGPWQIVFHISDLDLGYLMQTTNQVRWQVDYKFKSDNVEVHTCEIDRLDGGNTIQDDGRSYVKAFASFDASLLDEPRVGQSVYGKIKCGRRSLFFIWTRDVQDFLKTNFLWSWQ
jgi:hypothetical protein